MDIDDEFEAFMRGCMPEVSQTEHQWHLAKIIFLSGIHVGLCTEFPHRTAAAEQINQFLSRAEEGGERGFDNTDFIEDEP